MDEPPRVILHCNVTLDTRFVPKPAEKYREWWDDDSKTRQHARFCLPLVMANSLGYVIPSPGTFEVSWDGELHSDAKIAIKEIAQHSQIDGHSAHGSFTVHPGFIPVRSDRESFGLSVAGADHSSEASLVAARPNQVQPVSASFSKGKLLSQRSDKPNRSPRRFLVARSPVKRPGALKDSILAALQKAGDDGVAVKDLAAALGVKSRNIHVSFSSTGRKVKGLTKVGAGRWKCNGN